MSTTQSPVGVLPLPVARGGTNSTTGALTCSSGNITVQSGNVAATGNVTAIKSAPGASVLVQCTNSDNTAAQSPAGFEVAVGGATNTGDPYVNFLVSGAGSFTMGIDNSVSDNFVISTGTALGTNDNIRLVSGGAVSFLRGDVDVTRSATGNMGVTVANSSVGAGTDNAIVTVSSGGGAGGDAQTTYTVTGAQSWSAGVDNSASDDYVVSSGTVLGTSNAMSIAAADRAMSVVSVSQSNLKMTFASSPLLQSNADTGAAPTGATGDVNLMQLQGGWIANQFIIGAGQTIIAPRMTTTGLLTSLDLTNAEGAEYNFGVNPNNPFAYTIGTSPAFFIELQVNAADIGGLDPLLIGFRKQAANNGTYTNYTDVASIGARAATSADVAVIATNLNNGGFVYTNTTDAWTDGTTKTFKVLVSAAGVVTYTINGVAPSVTAAFTFDNGDVVMPFIHHVFGAATPGAINWISLAIGLQ